MQPILMGRKNLDTADFDENIVTMILNGDPQLTKKQMRLY